MEATRVFRQSGIEAKWPTSFRLPMDQKTPAQCRTG